LIPNETAIETTEQEGEQGHKVRDEHLDADDQSERVQLAFEEMELA